MLKVIHDANGSGKFWEILQYRFFFIIKLF